MKHLTLVHVAGYIALLACTGCGNDIFATQNTPKDLQQAQQNALSTHTTPAHPNKAAPASVASNAASGGSGNFTADGSDCNARAQSRMSLYDRPSTYPISDQERSDAFSALYSACMREHNWQVAGPVHSSTVMASNTSTTQLANLSPAAGGSRPSTTTVAGNTVVSSSSVPGATVIVIGGNKDTASQLSSLSPSAGGSYPANATVVMVGAPQGAAATPVTYPAIPAVSQAALPVAVPIAPPASAYKPAAPTPTMSYQPERPMISSTDAATANTASPLAGAHVLSQSAANQQLENVLEQ